MANKHLQFLEIPRRDPDKRAVEVRTKEFREIYAQYSAESASVQAGVDTGGMSILITRRRTATAF